MASYIVQEGDTWEKIATIWFDHAPKPKIIAEYNGYALSQNPEEGKSITIPSFMRQKGSVERGQQIITLGIAKTMVRVSLKCLFSDPEDKSKKYCLPKDMEVEVTYKDEEEPAKKLKLKENGLLYFEAFRSKKSFTLKFLPGDDQYLVVADKKEDQSELKSKSDADEAMKEGASAFKLPAEITLENSVWETGVPYENGWITSLDERGQKFGTKTQPEPFTLDPRWQYMRFVYFDRIIGGTEQISILPVTVEGYDEAPSQDSTAVTRSNWTIGTDDKKLVQCLPWIIKASENPKPDAKIELRFNTEENSFIETAADKSSRSIITDAEKNKPGADRLRFYDLPSEWRSKNYFVRTVPKGADDNGKFIGDLSDSDFQSTTKDKPFIFSLDDIVLYRGDPEKGELTEPLEALTNEEKVLVFSNTFAENTASKVSKEGVYKQVNTITTVGSQKHTDVFFPSSEDTVLERGGAKVKENYIKEYPDWTRLVIAKGSMFDAFDKRTIADDEKPDQVVGARAAVCWYDSAKDSSIKPPGEKIVPRPKIVSTPFFSIQPYFELEVEYDLEKFLQWPPKDKRRANSSHSDRKGQTVYIERDKRYIKNGKSHTL